MGYEPTYVSVMSHDQGCVMFMHGNTCHKVPAMIHSPLQKIPPIWDSHRLAQMLCRWH